MHDRPLNIGNEPNGGPFTSYKARGYGSLEGTYRVVEEGEKRSRWVEVGGRRNKGGECVGMRGVCKERETSLSQGHWWSAFVLASAKQDHSLQIWPRTRTVGVNQTAHKGHVLGCNGANPAPLCP